MSMDVGLFELHLQLKLELEQDQDQAGVLPRMGLLDDSRSSGFELLSSFLPSISSGALEADCGTDVNRSSLAVKV